MIVSFSLVQMVFQMILSVSHLQFEKTWQREHRTISLLIFPNEYFSATHTRNSATAVAGWGGQFAHAHGHGDQEKRRDQ